MEKLTYEYRFYQAVVYLCKNNGITYQMCYDWIHGDSEELQQAVLDGDVVEDLWWIQGIVIIDAAHIMASSPEEGRHLEIDYTNPYHHKQTSETD